MYVEAKPVSTFDQRQGWGLPGQQQYGTMEGPKSKIQSPLQRLIGMENAVPSFQIFVDRVPEPTNNHQNLSSVAPQEQNSVCSDEASGNEPPSIKRGTSSLYSRVTDWAADSTEPWQDTDLAKEYTDMLLRPVVYRASTSNLSKKPVDPNVLEVQIPGSFLNSTSPTSSRSSTPSPSYSRPPASLSPPPMVPQAAKQYRRTISLERAKEAMNAPGILRLLPEDLRAQTVGRVRSQRLQAVDLQPPPLDARLKNTLVDKPGQRKLLPVQHDSLRMFSQAFYAAKGSSQARDEHIRIATAILSQRQGRSRVKAMRTLGIAETDEPRGRVKAMEILGITEIDEPRGRTRQRTPMMSSQEHLIPPQRRYCQSPEPFDDYQFNSQVLAREYHRVIAHHYRQALDESAYHPAEASDNSDQDQLAFAPPPLFYGKPEQMHDASYRHSEAFVTQYDSSGGNIRSRMSSNGPGPSPRRFSMTPEPVHRRRPSSSGNISISPRPQRGRHWSPRASIDFEQSERQKARLPRQRSRSVDKRISQYYPHVMSRKIRTKNTRSRSPGKKKSKPGIWPPKMPAMPLLVAEIMANRVQTPKNSSEVHQGKSNETESMPIFHRIAEGAAKYADLLNQPKEMLDNDFTLNETAKHANPETAHLSSNPLKNAHATTDAQLGSSTITKTSFGWAENVINLARKAPTPGTPHGVGQAGPFDQSNTGGNFKAEEVRAERSLRPNFFGDFVENWREAKKKRRREDLKRMIRVIPAKD